MITNSTNKTSSYIIPLGSNSVNSGGILSFDFPTNTLKENSITMNILSKEQIINSLEFTKCCGKLKNDNNQFDKFTYPSDFFNSDSVNLTLLWLPSIIVLYSTEKLQPLSILSTVSNSIPYKVELISNNKELPTNWYFSHETEIIEPNKCTLKEENDRCKSSKVEILSSIKSDTEYLRFGFIYSNSSLSPFTLNIYKDSNIIARLSISGNSIKINSNKNNEKNIQLNNGIKTGEWVSGDIFIVSSQLNNIINSDEKIICKDYTEECSNSQNNSSWMSVMNDDSLLRYAYLKKNAIIDKVKNSNEISHNSTSITNSEPDNSVYYLYISLDNCIIAKIKTNENSFNNLELKNSQDLINLVYWRIKSGISPSVNIPSSELSNIKTNLKNLNQESNNK